MLNIVPMNQDGVSFYNQIDNRYLVSELVSVKVGRKGFSLDYAPLPKGEWREYPPNTRFTAEELCRGNEAQCLFAFLDGKLAGQAVVMENWNHLALIDDLRVDVRMRRQGVGRALMDACRAWAKGRGLRGVTLETQDTNPAACQFYESCGLLLGGVDRMLYYAFPEQMQKPPALRESALFFYQFFD